MSFYKGHGGAAPSVPPVNTNKDPCTDFYNYVNSKWQKHVNMPPYAGSYGVSEEIETDVRDTLVSIIEKQRRSEPTDRLSMLATSGLHTASQQNNIIDLQRTLNTFDCISDVNDVGHSIGAMNKIQSRAPISIVVAADSYNSSKCCIYLYEAQLGLPGKHYYSAENHILNKYAKLLKTVGNLMNIESLESAIVVEASLLTYMSDSAELSDIEFSYNPSSYHKLCETYKHVPWESILDGLGVDIKHARSAKFIVTNQRYFKEINLSFKRFALETWRIWMRAMVVLSFLEYLPPPYDDLHFELYGKALRGNSEKLPQKFLVQRIIQSFAPQALSRLFVTHAVAPGTKQRTTTLIELLKRATVDRLRNVEWMTPATKQTAITKVRAMRFQVGYPAHWKSELDSLEVVYNDRMLLNILHLSSQDTAEMIRDLEHGNCKKTKEKWTDGSFEVNAYYYPEGNMMVIPAGILRPPFFDLKRSDAWNLGGIGSAIGHEITHGFDDDGRLYDAQGNYKNWWKDSDERKYKQMTRDLIALFHGQPYAGGKVNGKLTLNENIADLGGMAIALQALKDSFPASILEKERKKAYADFFTSYAVSWRNKDRVKKARQSLFLDSHAPPLYRVNLIVRQFAEFYEAFDIPETHPGYVPVGQRLKLW
jgi:putative endopeptidase